MSAKYSEADHKRISNFVCEYECMSKTEDKCGRMLKISDYEYGNCLFLQLWILKPL